ncbi:hypothetical protein Pla110_02740 [Polystyrenella longa]|uniref:Uncharacterized protein n=1 Tax=Polystyrenella longa TaxID=2528007 RepID=A0A518CH69_9PLAN|nr:hypothetical protein [Polystyrenella longa]QDU78570.1 hypothetical protein Pla110_02740 [Polystyrenella longa]
MHIIERTDQHLAIEMIKENVALIDQVINAVEFAMGHLSKVRYYQPTFFEGIDAKEVHRRIRVQWLPGEEKYREENSEAPVAIRLEYEEWAFCLFILKEAVYGCAINSIDLDMTSGYSRQETREVLESLHELIVKDVYRLYAADKIEYKRSNGLVKSKRKNGERKRRS